MLPQTGTATSNIKAAYLKLIVFWHNSVKKEMTCFQLKRFHVKPIKQEKQELG